MSSNALDLPVLSNLDFFNDNNTLVTTKGYHKNTCLRAPGASCFTNLDCAPNNFISGKIKTVSSFLNQMSDEEQEFWKEELVCGNGQDRYQPNDPSFPNPAYDTSLNRCCRETGKQITYYSEENVNPTFTATVAGDSQTPAIPGVNIDLDSPLRYSRNHTTYDKQINSDGSLNADYPPLTKASSTSFLTDPKKNYIVGILKQYNTLHLNNSRVCCTGGWVREFDDGVVGNGGGHKFSGTSGQNYDFESFKYLNWFENNLNSADGLIPFQCDVNSVGTTACEIRNIAEGSAYETKTLNWLGKFELLGIPQVLIETNKTYNGTTSAPNPQDFYVAVDDNQDASDANAAKVLPGTIKSNGFSGAADAEYAGVDYYSAGNMENFEVGPGAMKTIFSEDKFNCCIPAGPAAADTTNSECCTGQFTSVAGSSGVTGPRCCLPGNTDVTVYTNRYVSSEGATLNGQEITDAQVDPLTGYLKKEIVLQLAVQMCCSGQATFGSAIGDFADLADSSTGQVSPQTSRRFIEDASTDQPGASIFANGRKWNNHVYCLDSSTGTGGTTGGGATGGQ
jgi:hypothetical protein